jgi:hypothetical protein
MKVAATLLALAGSAAAFVPAANTKVRNDGCPFKD